MDERDASNAGVRPGGLVNETEIRILVCYLLSNVDEPVPESRMRETLHFIGMVNYFELGEAVSDLEQYGHIKKVSDENGERMYVITDSGRSIAKTLETSVPRSVRNRTTDALNKLLLRIRIEKETVIKICPATTGCIVSCSYMEGDLEMMTIRVQVPNELEALHVKEHFLDNATDIYMKTYEAMTGIKMG